MFCFMAIGQFAMKYCEKKQNIKYETIVAVQTMILIQEAVLLGSGLG